MKHEWKKNKSFPAVSDLFAAAIVRSLTTEGCEILTTKRAKLDLRHSEQVDQWMAAAKPGRRQVGGILGKRRSSSFNTGTR
jgi:hypothetical protein